MGLQALNINFVQSPARMTIGAAAALVLAASAVCGVWWVYDRSQAELHALEARARKLPSSPLKDAKRERGAPAAAGNESAAPMKAIAQLQQPWSGMLDQVARAAGQRRVAVLAVDADGANRTIRLVAHAQDFAHAVAFVEDLKHASPLSSANLVSHEMTTGAEPGVRFNAELTWKPLL